MCEFSGKLVALLDGELAAAEVIALERHLEMCADCRNRLRAYERVSNSVEAYCDTKMGADVPRTMVTRRFFVPGVRVAAVVAIVAMLVFLPRMARRAHVEQPVAIAAANIAPVLAVASQASLAAEDVAEGHRAASSPARKMHRHAVAAPAKIQQASWTPPEPAIEIAIPADAVLPPGAVPEGFAFVANVRFAADGSGRQMIVWP